MSEQHEQGADTFELMDKEDEDQILQELRGVPVDKFIYKNARGEWDLSYAGTKWIVRKMAEEAGEAIRVDGHPKVERCVIDPEYITCTVLGKRVKVNLESKSEILLDTNIGAARGWIKQRMKDGTIKADDFFFNKTTSKAIRNLQQSLIPTDFKKAMVSKLIEMQGRGGGAGQQRPPQGQQQSRQQSGPPDEHGQGAPKHTEQQAPPKQQSQQSAPKQDTQKPAQGQQSSPPAQGGEKTLEVVQQHFRAVFLQFAKTDNKTTLQAMLKSLTGKTAITELERQVMTDLGPLLRKVVNGELKFTGTAIMGKDGTQIYPKPPPKQAQEAPPAQSDSEPMF